MPRKRTEEKENECEWEMWSTLPTQRCMSDQDSRPHRINIKRSLRSRSYPLMKPAPIRMTSSIFKQPVTVYNSCKQNPKVNDFIYGRNQEKPMQLCWAKRLQGFRPCYPDGTEFAEMHLPIGMEPAGPNVTEETSVLSLASALFKPTQRVTGQIASELEFLEPKQPLVECGHVTNNDIIGQERRVLLARRKLQEALKCKK